MLQKHCGVDIWYCETQMHEEVFRIINIVFIKSWNLFNNNMNQREQGITHSRKLFLYTCRFYVLLNSYARCYFYSIQFVTIITQYLHHRPQYHCPLHWSKCHAACWRADPPASPWTGRHLRNPTQPLATRSWWRESALSRTCQGRIRWPQRWRWCHKPSIPLYVWKWGGKLKK